ncbi:hypothetical protein AB3S75_028595 [Citrus x aurantiifolia]
MARTKYYVVFVGWKPGVYDSWAKCHLQVNGFAGNSFKSYKSLESAQNAYEEHCAASKEVSTSQITQRADEGNRETSAAFIARQNDSALTNRRWLEVGVVVGVTAVITAVIVKLMS